MMANLAASLVAAEASSPPRPRPRPAPIAEKLITKAKKAQDDEPMRRAPIRQIQAYLGDQEMTSSSSTTSPRATPSAAAATPAS
jgi:large subunit ribosomal protein L17